jgi:choline dehydrogenase-like flavoprotein
LTLDSHIYHKDNAASTYALYREKKTGVLSTFPFGIFGYARLDERLDDSPIWKSAPRAPGRDPMGITPSQPHVEYANLELYGGPKHLTDFPKDDEHTFAMCVLLFNQQSRGTVTLKSKNPLDNPVVDHNYLANPLDMLVLSKGCQFANEIIVEGKGTKDVISGSWPANLSHHLNKSPEDWEHYVRENATTCT